MIKNFLFLVSLMCTTATFAATPVNGRWQNFYEDNDSVRIKNGVSVTVQKIGDRSGAYIKTGLWTWDFENRTVTFKIKVSDWVNMSRVMLTIGNGIALTDLAYVDLREVPISKVSNEWIEVAVPPSSWVKEGNVKLDDIDVVLVSIAGNTVGLNAQIVDILILDGDIHHDAESTAFVGQ